MPDIRVFIADKNEILREGINHLVNVQPDMQAVGEATTGLGALYGATAHSPNVIVLDISIDIGRCLTITKRIHADCPEVRILVMGEDGDVNLMLDLYFAGVSGYILKTSGIEEIIKAIRILDTGRLFLDQAITNKLDWSDKGNGNSGRIRAMEILQ